MLAPHLEAGAVVAKKGIVQQIQGFLWSIINVIGLFFSTINPVRVLNISVESASLRLMDGLLLTRPNGLAIDLIDPGELGPPLIIDS